MSDYSLLNDTTRVVGNAESLIKTLDDNNNGIGRNRARRLAQVARSRGVRLSFMPRGMARHTRNTSTIKTASKARALNAGLKDNQMLFWHLDVYFVGTSLGVTQLVKVESCAEDTTVEYILKGTLCTLARKAKRRRLTAASSDREAAAIYELCEVDELVAFIQNEYAVPPDTNDEEFAGNVGRTGLHRFSELDQSSKLFEVLKGRCVVEFPVLYVAKKDTSAAKSLESAAIGIFERPEPDSESSSSGSEYESDSDSSPAAECDSKQVEHGELPPLAQYGLLNSRAGGSTNEQAHESNHGCAPGDATTRAPVIVGDPQSATTVRLPLMRNRGEKKDARKSRFGSLGELNKSAAVNHPPPMQLSIPEGRVPRKPKVANA